MACGLLIRRCSFIVPVAQINLKNKKQKNVTDIVGLLIGISYLILNGSFFSGKDVDSLNQSLSCSS